MIIDAFGRIWNWCLCLALTLLGVVTAYYWIDRPVAYFVHANIVWRSAFIWMQRLPEALPIFSVIALVGAGLWTLIGRALSRCQSVMVLCGLSFIATGALNYQLKFAFGRMWPETYVNNNPSLIQIGAYGFSPFHGGSGFASFPSGHAAAIFSVMTVLWLSYPRWRALFALLEGVVAVGLLGGDYHFVSDILAGGFVGWTTGWIAVDMARRWSFTGPVQK